ncbi:hypothetical protein V8E36_006979 [Tilletia maclaganii]
MPTKGSAATKRKQASSFSSSPARKRSKTADKGSVAGKSVSFASDKGKGRAIDTDDEEVSPSPATSALSPAKPAPADVSSTSDSDSDSALAGPVFQPGNSYDLLKQYSPSQLLGLKTDDRMSPISSDENEGLGSWTEKDEHRWRQTLVQAQDETSEQTFVIDELLRWREHPRRSGVFQYRVAWQGYPIYACTWEPASSFDRETLDEFWARKKGKPDFIPIPGSDDEVISAHNSDTDFASFHHLDAAKTKDKIAKMRAAWRKDKSDLRFVKQLRREERESRRLLAAAGGPALSSSSSSAASASRDPQTHQWVIPPHMPESDADDDMESEPIAQAAAKVVKRAAAASKGKGSASAAANSSSSSPAKGKGKKAAAKATKAPTESASPAPPTPSSAASKSTKAKTAAKGKGKAAAPLPARAASKGAPGRTGPTADDEVVIISSDEDDGSAPPPAPKARPTRATKAAPAAAKKAASPAKTAVTSPAKGTSKSSPAAARGGKRRRADSTPPVEEDPSDGDIEDAADDDDGNAADAAARETNVSDDDEFFDRSRGKKTHLSVGGSSSQIVIPTRDGSTTGQTPGRSAGAASTAASSANKSATAARAAAAGSSVASGGIGGVPAHVRNARTSSSPLTSVQSDSEASVVNAFGSAVKATAGTAKAKRASPAKKTKVVRMAVDDEVEAAASTPAASPRKQAVSPVRQHAAPDSTAKKSYSLMPVPGRGPSHFGLSEQELAEAARTGRRATSILARKKLSEDAIATAAAEIVEMDEEDDPHLAGQGVSMPEEAGAAPVLVRRGVAAFLAKQGGAASASAGPSIQRGGPPSPVLSAEQRMAKERAEEADRRRRLAAAAMFVTRPDAKAARRSAADGHARASGSSNGAAAAARNGTKGAAAATNGASSGSSPTMKGSYKGAHRAGPKIQRIGLVADPLPASKRHAAARAAAKANGSPSKATSLADLPSIPRKAVVPGPSASSSGTQAQGGAIVVDGANAAAAAGAEDDLGDLWGSDNEADAGPQASGSLPNGTSAAPAASTSWAAEGAVQQDTFMDIAAGWDDEAPPAQPAVAPGRLGNVAQEAAAQQDAFMDAAGGWDDPEPPALPPSAAAAAAAPTQTQADSTMWGGEADQGFGPTGNDDFGGYNEPQTAFAGPQVRGPTPATTIRADLEGAAQMAAFEDAATGWDDPEPPAPAPPAATQTFGQQQALPPQQSSSQQIPEPIAMQMQQVAIQQRDRFEQTAAGWGDDEPSAPAPPMQMPTGLPTRAMAPHLGVWSVNHQAGPPRQANQLPPGLVSGGEGFAPGPTGMSSRAISDWQASLPAGFSTTMPTPLPHAHGAVSTPQSYQQQDNLQTPTMSGGAAWGGGGGATPSQAQSTPAANRIQAEKDEAQQRFEEAASGWEMDEPPVRQLQVQPHQQPKTSHPSSSLANDRTSSYGTAPQAGSVPVSVAGSTAGAGVTSDELARKNFEEAAAGWEMDEPPEKTPARTTAVPTPVSSASGGWDSSSNANAAPSGGHGRYGSRAQEQPSPSGAGAGGGSGDWRTGLSQAWGGVKSIPPHQPYQPDRQTSDSFRDRSARGGSRSRSGGGGEAGYRPYGNRRESGGHSGSWSGDRNSRRESGGAWSDRRPYGGHGGGGGGGGTSWNEQPPSEPLLPSTPSSSAAWGEVGRSDHDLGSRSHVYPATDRAMIAYAPAEAEAAADADSQAMPPPLLPASAMATANDAAAARQRFEEIAAGWGDEVVEEPPAAAKPKPTPSAASPVVPDAPSGGGGAWSSAGLPHRGGHANDRRSEWDSRAEGSSRRKFSSSYANGGGRSDYQSGPPPPPPPPTQPASFRDRERERQAIQRTRKRHVPDPYDEDIFLFPHHETGSSPSLPASPWERDRPRANATPELTYGDVPTSTGESGPELGRHGARAAGEGRRRFDDAAADDADAVVGEGRGPRQSGANTAPLVSNRWAQRAAAAAQSSAGAVDASQGSSSASEPSRPAPAPAPASAPSSSALPAPNGPVNGAGSQTVPSPDPTAAIDPTSLGPASDIAAANAAIEASKAIFDSVAFAAPEMLELSDDEEGEFMGDDDEVMLDLGLEEGGGLDGVPEEGEWVGGQEIPAAVPVAVAAAAAGGGGDEDEEDDGMEGLQILGKQEPELTGPSLAADLDNQDRPCPNTDSNAEAADRAEAGTQLLNGSHSSTQVPISSPDELQGGSVAETKNAVQLSSSNATALDHSVAVVSAASLTAASATVDPDANKTITIQTTTATTMSTAAVTTAGTAAGKKITLDDLDADDWSEEEEEEDDDDAQAVEALVL